MQKAQLKLDKDTPREDGHYFKEKDEKFSQKEQFVKVHPITLTFSRSVEEKEFRKKLHNKSKRLTRISLGMAILFFLCMYPSDRYFESYNEDQVRIRDIIRSIQLPIATLWLYLTHVEWFADYYIVFTASATLAIGVLAVGTSIGGSQPDHGPHMLYLFFAWLFVRLPYFAAVLVCWPIFFVYCIGVPLLVDDVNSKSSSGNFRISATYLLLTNVALNLAAFFIERLDRKEFLHSKSIEREDQVNKDLLLNLLPRSITAKLEQTVGSHGRFEPIANYEESVSILFSDLVGFTRYASTISARSLVNFLNELYHQFDQLCDDVGAYKVETIGDAYFVSAGCPEKNDFHALCLVELGLLMIRQCQEITLENGKHPSIRVGIHSGPVMAGVVGKKMPRYHLFGRTVTVAEKMESTGQPNRVQVSSTTYDMIKDEYECIEHKYSEELGQSYLIAPKHLDDLLGPLDELLEKNAVNNFE